MLDYSGHCLTLIGTASIQSYIFWSNALAENAGASQAVYEAIEYWRKAKDPEEVLYVGGGNAAVLFRDRAAARAAIGEWSYGLTQSSPGLRVVAVHRVVDSTLRAAYRAAVEDLQRAENQPAFGSPLGGLPVVKICPSTGLGASEKYIDPDKIESWISAEACGKRKQSKASYARLLDECFEEVLTNCGVQTRFPRDFDNLGVTEGASQIAVVHADGDGIGKVLSGIVDKNQSDPEFAAEIQSFSDNLDRLGQDALRKTVLDLVVTRDQWLDPEVSALDERGRFLVPMRPIVWGGDDLTFVTNGRLGVALAARYLENFSAKSQEYLGRWLPTGKDGFTSSAGVAIVPLKFPFSRAYDMAEKLAFQAKKKRREDGSHGSWLDLQIVMEGANESLDATRAAMYPKRIMDNWRRPYRVDDRAWENFNSDFALFSEWPRTRAKHLFESITTGGPSLDALTLAYAARGYALPGDNDFERYFDPLEFHDFYKRIDWANRPTPGDGQ